MKMRKLFIFLPLLLFFTPCVFCQKSLQISFTRFGKIKTHEVYVGDRIHYKLISESRFRKNRITHLQDSLIFFENDSSIVLRKIRRLRFRKEALYTKPIQRLFLENAILFPLITSVGHATNHDPPYLREGAVIVSLSSVVAFFILEGLQIKNVRITKRKTIKIVDMNFKNFNQK